MSETINGWFVAINPMNETPAAYYIQMHEPVPGNMGGWTTALMAKVYDMEAAQFICDAANVAKFRHENPANQKG